MRNILFILLAMFSFSSYAEETSDGDMNAVIEMMVVAKATGMCGVISQMVNFQQATKMPGGDEFVVRFLTTEAARLGHTLESFTGQCPSVFEKYNSTMKLLGFEQ